MTSTKNEFQEWYKNTLHHQVSQPISDEEKTNRMKQGDLDWNEQLKKVINGEYTTMHLAMWIQYEGYRVSNFNALNETWNMLIDEGY